MNISLIGSGYVGLVTGACFADLGNKVICVDNNAAKIKDLKANRMPIYEPGLSDLIKRNVKESRLSFTTNLKESVNRSDIIFIAVNTPPKENGEADLVYVEKVSKEIALSMRSYKLVVEKSTVPVNTGEWVERTIKTFNKHNIKFDVASNPEFLREGSAIEDFMNPDRIVIGVSSSKARDILTKLYRPLKAPIIVTDIKSAEIIKHASNSFLAMKISFINAVSDICDRIGADVVEVAKGMGLDKRIGEKFLAAGIGFGGSCFPKDLTAFIKMAERAGYDFALLKEVAKINRDQKALVIKRIEERLWNLPDKVVGVLGLSFKPNTDDIRNAPAFDIISALVGQKVKVKVYDPVAMPKAKAVLKHGVKFCKDAYETARQSDCLVIATEWNEFKELDFKKIKRLMRQAVIIDGRNIYNPDDMKKLGFNYTGIGRR
ncbi:MAG: UDP-glucose/GDP-mannose dehydrogenase family protein [Candidatus Omnitrophica bacterium]|nr:UDP-glucose/GDP-mannose dehydrogenase family protein [Candidatus Omnitrophota bacterium]MCM8790665.1 UDP-glucose/GDP-mannose dehydrogenase family protein [Candidatus Omnitrophota bacterium]